MQLFDKIASYFLIGALSFVLFIVFIGFGYFNPEGISLILVISITFIITMWPIIILSIVVGVIGLLLNGIIKSIKI